LLAASLYQGNIDRNYKPWNIVSPQRYTIPYEGAAGMLLHINGKLTMGKLTLSFILNQPSMSVSRCRSRHWLVFYITFRNISALSL